VKDSADSAAKARERLYTFYLQFTPQPTLITADAVNDARDVAEMFLKIFLQHSQEACGPLTQQNNIASN